MTVHNHRFSIPRSPAVSYDAEPEERLPFPYNYHQILLSPAECEQHRLQFIKNVQQRRFAYIKAAEPPRPKK